MNDTIMLAEGLLKGTEEAEAFVFRGVPFARAERFGEPMPPLPWEGVREALAFGKIAPQAPHKTVGLYGREFYQDLDSIPPQSEDCLYLNIWTPKTEGPHPVAVWIHGGGFGGGYSSEIEFDGTAFARRGVILVTVAYRLGLLGFPIHPELHSFNFGLRDQLAALDWVRGHIAAFGGDPEELTLFGQSAGAISVELLAESPYAKGKVKRFIIQSDVGFYADHRLRPEPRGLKRLMRPAGRFWRKRGLSLEELRQMPARELIGLNEAYSSYMRRRSSSPFLPGPCVDGDVVPESLQRAVRRGRMHPASYLAGCLLNDLFEAEADEAAYPRHRLLRGVRLLCRRLNRSGRPAYAYFFTHKLPGDGHGAFHSAELWYVFGTYRRCWRPLTEEDARLSDEMCDVWCRFIRTGDPGWAPEAGREGAFRIFS